MRTDAPTLSDSTSSRDALLVLGAFTVGQAIQVDNGVIHPAALGWLCLSIICFTAAMMPAIHRRFTLFSKINTTWLLLACMSIQWAELLVWDIRWGSRTAAMVGCLLLVVVGVMLSFRVARWGLLLIVLGHFFAGALTIQSSPKPGIDVWYFQDESTAALLHGRYPYAVRFRDLYGPETGFYSPGMSVNGWLTYSFPYPPLMLLTTAPGRFFGDVRWAHLVALELSAILIVAAAGFGGRSILATAMLLLCPRSLLVIKVGWTEPMVLLMLAAVIYTACRAPRWLWFSFGLLLAIKQYTILAAPLLLL
ncbi:MAG TPA: hypothetical protein VKK61_03560, partial [Tepidisphaeraceae bacterium]|nr:hypothetical protein [Tepidisphaeraceae bacterium]